MGQTTAMDAAWNIDATGANDSVAIVLGIGGKADLLLDLDRVRADRVPTFKRFSGGGTVVLDYNSIWTTVIGRRDELVVQPHYPRPVMQYTADCIYGPMFLRLAAMQTLKTTTTTTINSSSSSSNSSSRQMDRDRAGQKLTMVLDTKSCAGENTGRLVTVPRHGRVKGGADDDVVSDCEENGQSRALAFRLRENDYVMGERKMGGNAQAIGKTGWLHHTSFLWDYQAANMAYLTLPSKRPAYRGDRSHADFLVALKHVYPALSKADFFAALARTCEEEFDVERVTVPEAMKIVDAQGGMKAWLHTKSRTKVLTDV